MKTRLLRKRREPPPHPALRLIRIAAGTVVLIAGILMSVPGVPGQGILAVLAGLWLLSADVPMARRALIRLRILCRRARKKYRSLRERRRRKAENRSG